MRPARSYLFVPGDRGDLIDKAVNSGAEAVVLDLENSIHDDRKDQAREALAAHLVRMDRPDRRGASRPELWVRINGLDTPFWKDDVHAAVCAGLTGLRVPKTEDGIEDLEREIARAEARHGLPANAMRLTCNIESTAGLLRAPAFASRPRVARLAFGGADFLANLGGFASEDSPMMLWARCQVVAVSRAAGLVPPIASPHTALQDLEGLERTCWEARELGFYGRSALHPRQLPIIHKVFRTQPEELRWARHVLDVAQRTDAARECAAVDVDGSYIGPPMVARARMLLALAAPDDLQDAIQDAPSPPAPVALPREVA